MAIQFGDAVVYNGGEGKSHELAFVTTPTAAIDDSTGITNLYVVDGEGNGSIKTDVPRRSPDDYEAGGGGGHTWFYRD